MGQDPDAIRREVMETRERMGETIDALGYKADVKTRTKENISGKVDTVKEKLGVATDKVGDVTGKVGDATPDGQQVKQQAQRAVGVAQENPLGLAVGAAAVGFLAGMLVPSSRIEDEKLGPMADQVKEQVKQTGQEALEHGKQVAQSAAETVKDEAQDHGQQLAERARENAGSVSAS
jgi:ElaB/YqjD/DUF883 family membrane-anchored ribosome-binding protein